MEVVDAPHIDGARTLGVHRVLQAVMHGNARTGELYDYSAQFGDYQVIVIANPLVVPDQPAVPGRYPTGPRPARQSCHRRPQLTLRGRLAGTEC